MRLEHESYFPVSRVARRSYGCFYFRRVMRIIGIYIATAEISYMLEAPFRPAEIFQSRFSFFERKPANARHGSSSQSVINVVFAFYAQFDATNFSAARNERKSVPASGFFYVFRSQIIVFAQPERYAIFKAKARAIFVVAVYNHDI